MFSGLGIMPCAYLSYFDGDALIQPNLALNFTASASFIGGAFIGLTEVDANGAVVRALSFTGTLGITGMVWAKHEQAENNGLSWVTLKGTQPGQDYEIYVTFLMSDKVGIVNKVRFLVLSYRLKPS